MFKSNQYLTYLYDGIDKHFDLSEIKLLCFHIGIDYDHLGGDTKPLKIINLISLCGRFNNLPELVTQLQKARPKILWEKVPSNFVFPVTDYQDVSHQIIKEQFRNDDIENQPTVVVGQGNIINVQNYQITGDISGDVHISGDAHIISKHSKNIPPPPPLSSVPRIEGFIGRRDELAYYSEKLNSKRLAVISGMAGVGKTALAVKLAHQNSYDEQLFWLQFFEGEGAYVFIRKLAIFLAHREISDLWKMLESSRILGNKPPPIEDLFNYLGTLLYNESFLLCLDDFQFLDDDPHLNKFLKQIIHDDSYKIRIIIISRRLPSFVHSTETRKLMGLSEADTQDLLNMHNLELPDSLINDLYKYTEGNSQFLNLAINVMRDLKDRSRLIDNLAQAEDIERFLMLEVNARLNDNQQLVMEAVASLLGFPGSRDVIETMLNRSRLKPILHDLTQRQLLFVSDGANSREYYQHSILQAFYYEQVGRRRRRQMHQYAGEYYETEEIDYLKSARHHFFAGSSMHSAELATSHMWTFVNEGQSSQLSELLELFGESQIENDLWATVLLVKAQLDGFFGERQSANVLFEEALTYAKKLLPNEKRQQIIGQIYIGKGELIQFSEPEQALELFEQGLEELGETNQLTQAKLFSSIGFVYMNLGEYTEATKAFQNSLERLPNEPSQTLGNTYMHLGAINFYQGDYEQAISNGLKALEISQQLYDFIQMANILSNLGSYKYSAGDWTGAIDDFNQSVNLADRIGSKVLKSPIEGNLGVIYIYTGDFDLAEKYLLNVLEVTHAHDQFLYESIVRYQLANLYIRKELWEEAEKHLEESVKLALKVGGEPDLTERYCAWAVLKLGIGDIESALDYINESINKAQDCNQRVEEGMSRRVLGKILCLQNNLESATKEFEKSLLLIREDDPYESARTKMEMGKALISNQEVSTQNKGYVLLEQAKKTFVELGAKYEISLLDSL